MKLLILLCTVASATALVTRLELNRIESRRSKLMRTGLWRQHLKQKLLLRATAKIDNKAVGQQNINDYENVGHVGNITIGSNHDMEFVVVLDTASANFWVPDSSCNTKDCNNMRKYDSSKSADYVKDGRTWNFQDASGIYGIDTMTLGGSKEQQLIIEKQTFGQASSIDGFSFDGIDGILGLGFTSLSADDVAPPVITAVNQGALDAPLFTVWLAHRDHPKKGSAGLFTYGALDNDNCGPQIEKVKLSTATYWQFKMNAIAAGSYSNSKGWEVISDTATSWMGGPPSVIEGLATALGAEYDWYYEFYSFDCATKPGNLKLTIGSNVYEIESENYIVDYGDDLCALTFFEIDFGAWGPAWILGDPFNRQFCQILYVADEAIGFAKSIQKT